MNSKSNKNYKYLVSQSIDGKLLYLWLILALVLYLTNRVNDVGVVHNEQTGNRLQGKAFVCTMPDY